MKKKFLLILLLIICGFNLNAQNLSGTSWLMKIHFNPEQAIPGKELPFPVPAKDEINDTLYFNPNGYISFWGGCKYYQNGNEVDIYWNWPEEEPGFMVQKIYGTVNGNYMSGTFLRTQPNCCFVTGFWSATKIIDKPAAAQSPNNSYKPTVTNQSTTKQANNSNAFQPTKTEPSHLYGYDKKAIDNLYSPNPISSTGNTIYNTRPIVFPKSSSEGMFLIAENQKFNSKNDIKSEGKASAEDIDEAVYIRDQGKALMQEYHPEPPVTQILEGENVKEKQDDATWDKWSKKSQADGVWEKWIGKLLISDKTIQDPVVRDIVDKNASTIESFNGRVDDILNTTGEVIEGSPSSEKLDNELDGLQSGSRDDIVNTQVNSRVDEIKKSIVDETIERPIEKGTVNAIESILSFPEEEKRENEN